jgi:nitrate/nitrite-specific signal transduction histidine kinase
VAILLLSNEGRVSMSICDNGSGIREPAEPTTGMGLRTMLYRAGIIGATLEVRPGTGGGTEIVCTVSE